MAIDATPVAIAYGKYSEASISDGTRTLAHLWLYVNQIVPKVTPITVVGINGGNGTMVQHGGVHHAAMFRESGAMRSVC